MIEINRNSNYYKQVDLLIDSLQFIMINKSFALKGGTAINLFIRDIPRFSVDIDLAYIDIKSRDVTLDDINDSFLKFGNEIKSRLPSINIDFKKSSDNNIKQIVINKGYISIKIEINTIIRGCVYDCYEMDLSHSAQNIFKKFVSVNCLSFEDLYAGKMVAALDRQHPRDLFDIKLLFEKEGFTDKFKDAFIVYLISSNRPISELLNPNILDIENLYKREFKGMILTENDCTFEDLNNTRIDLIETINKSFNDNDKEFLLSFKLGDPKWNLLNVQNAKLMPAIKWKLENIHKLDKAKHIISVNKLKNCLNLIR